MRTLCRLQKKATETGRRVDMMPENVGTWNSLYLLYFFCHWLTTHWITFSHLDSFGMNFKSFPGVGTIQEKHRSTAQELVIAQVACWPSPSGRMEELRWRGRDCAQLVPPANMGPWDLWDRTYVVMNVDKKGKKSSNISSILHHMPIWEKGCLNSVWYRFRFKQIASDWAWFDRPRAVGERFGFVSDCLNFVSAHALFLVAASCLCSDAQPWNYGHPVDKFCYTHTPQKNLCFVHEQWIISGIYIQYFPHI